MSLVRGRLALSGRRLPLGALDHPSVTVGLTIGNDRYAGTGAFRARGRRRVFP
jgi:hypothetical protein